MGVEQLKEHTTGDAYRVLREWYLARLRKGILELAEVELLTPSALIKADREAIEQMVLSSRALPQAAYYHEKDVITLPLTQWILVVVLLFPAIVLALVLTVSDPFVERGFLAVVLLVTTVLSFSAFLVFFQRLVSKRLSRLHKAWFTEEPAGDGDEIQRCNEVLRRMDQLRVESANREFAIADFALDIICAVDKGARVIAMSPSSIKLFGYAPAELLGTCLLELVVSEDQEKTANFIANTRTGRHQILLENRLKHKDGTIVEVSWSAEWSNTHNFLFMQAHDITDRKRVERLRQEFVAIASHDLRTPLTTFSCTIDLLRAGACGRLNEKGFALLEAANSSIANLLGLINDLLDLEKMEAGKIELEVENIELGPLLKQATDTILAVSQKKNVSVYLEETNIAVVCDRKRIFQVVINLLSNALKASPPDTQISITAKSQEYWTQIRITDQGCGIPSHAVDLIFERYQQAKKDDRGSGLGLAICKAIVEAHGGIIGVESKEGQGSSFWFCLPIAFPQQLDPTGP